MPQRTQFVPNAPVIDQLEHLRQGTFEKYESEWVLIRSGANHVFTHNLDDVPVMVDVIRSDLAAGDNPRTVDADVTGGEEATIVKTDTSITVTNNVTTAVNGMTDFYFKVRAF